MAFSVPEHLRAIPSCDQGAVFISACVGYVPRLRVKKGEYLGSLGSFAAPGIAEKAVGEFDEDAVTMAVEASRVLLALAFSPDNTCPLRGLHLASTSLPYAEKVQAATVVEALGLPPGLFCSEHTTSSRAGTEALLTAAHHIATAHADETVMVVAAEAPRLSPLEPAEHPLGAGAVALLLGRAGWARLTGYHSVAGEALGIGFRPAGSSGPRDLGLTAYAQCLLEARVREAVAGLAAPATPAEYLAGCRLVIPPQPDARLPAQLARSLGLKPEQTAPGLVAARWGDSRTALPFLSLAAACSQGDGLQSGDRVLVISQGWGMAVDVLALEITARPVVDLQLPPASYLDFSSYLRLRRDGSGE
ncbi:MAG TPA: hypothetical protein GX513_08550 [Firmicutes bacterium]|nr:hypothetical protein [Bacillota bacterium]